MSQIVINPTVFYYCVATARREDAAKCGVAVDVSTWRTLRRSQSIALSRQLAAAASSVFNAELNDVRVHIGPAADAFLQHVRMPAACLGNRLVLSTPVLNHPQCAVDAVTHELAHLAGKRHELVVRGWSADHHANLSREACNACRPVLKPVAKMVGLSWDEFLLGVANASSNMDVRQRIFHPNDTADYLAKSYVLNPLAGLFGVKLGTPGEGPRHGEAYNYRSSDLRYNRCRNLTEQGKHARLAAREFLLDKGLQIALGRNFGPKTQRRKPGEFPTGSRKPSLKQKFDRHIGGISVWEREWIKSLANSLHVAQDRGSHREGTKGFGHDDPREGKVVNGDKWCCDDKEHGCQKVNDWLHCSMAAYNVAFNNSVQSICTFVVELSPLLHKVGLINKSLPLPVIARLPTKCKKR